MTTSPACAPVAGLRERKKRRRRDALVDAAQALVLEHGLDNVTVEDVCEEVGVSPRTFFNYFPAKDDAVLGLEDLGLSPEVAATFEAGGPTGVLLDDLGLLVGEILEHQVTSPERLHRTVELVRREPRLLARHMAWADSHRVELVGLCTRRRESHAFPVEPEIAAVVAMAMVQGVGIEWSRQDFAGTTANHLIRVKDQLRALVAT